MRRVGLLLGVAVALVGQAPKDPPAPTVDRVLFPTGYQNWKVLYKFDRPDNKSVRTIYGNDLAAAMGTNTQQEYFYGAVIVMETQRALQDKNGVPILANGRFQKDPTAAPTVFVMRKGLGLGDDYGPNKNGDWAYSAYHTDGTFQTAPEKSFSCAICHLQAGQWRDWVFRNTLYFSHASGAVPNGTIQNYTFVPGAIHGQPGSTITIYNDDVIQHTVVADAAGGTDSGLLNPGASTSITVPADASGEINYHCRLHANMHVKVVVDQPQQ
jgi:plastocyanin